MDVMALRNLPHVQQGFDGDTAMVGDVQVNLDTILNDIGRLDTIENQMCERTGGIQLIDVVQVTQTATDVCGPICFKDTGDGDTHDECAASAALANWTVQENRPATYQIKDPFNQLKIVDREFAHQLCSYDGVSLDQIIAYSNRSYGKYAIFTSMTSEGYFNCSNPHKTWK